MPVLRWTYGLIAGTAAVLAALVTLSLMIYLAGHVYRAVIPDTVAMEYKKHAAVFVLVTRKALQVADGKPDLALYSLVLQHLSDAYTKAAPPPGYDRLHANHKKIESIYKSIRAQHDILFDAEVNSRQINFARFAMETNAIRLALQDLELELEKL